MSPNYSLSTEQIAQALAGHDLHDYDGWMAAALALLADAPDWTALKQDGGLVVKTTYNGKPYISACAEHEEADAIYSRDDLYVFDRSAWDGESWDEMEAAVNVGSLTNPVFLALPHESTTYSLTHEQVQAAIAGHDLRTYDGWLAAASALLADAPALTGITEGNKGQVVLKVDFDGNVDVYPYWDEKRDGIFYEEYLSDFDRSAWDDQTQSWDSVPVEENIAVLINPVFVTLRQQ
ncbi:hypothetical protein ACLS0R_07500 [Comamonas jiangduensis]|uniref:hypothetical protein n=1 Tax=Comamonas jiangduensis TaxID=1194168 RepID=UPI003BF8533F